MKGIRENIDKILVWSLPVLFIIVFLLAFLMRSRIDKDVARVENRQETEATESAAVEPAVIETESQSGQEEQAAETGQQSSNVQLQVVESGKSRQWLEQMSLPDKVAQLFMITADALTGVDGAKAAGTSTAEDYAVYPVGGMIYFEANMETDYQLRELLKNMRQIAEERVGVPIFLSVDEEGGSVARVANHGAFPVENPGSMLSVGQSGDPQTAYNAGIQIGSYLKDYGFNLDYAPVADVSESGGNAALGDRSFGTDPETVSQMVSSAVDGFHSQGMLTTLKYFSGDIELQPFKAGIAAGTDFVMAASRGTDGQEPACFSEDAIQNILREQLGFQGVVITDAMNTEATIGSYGAADAAVKALQAGCDMILMPEDFPTAYQGVLDALAGGTLTEKRIDESVLRILKAKEKIQ